MEQYGNKQDKSCSTSLEELTPKKRLIHVGNRLFVSIDYSIAKTLGLSEGDFVEQVVVEDLLVLKKVQEGGG